MEKNTFVMTDEKGKEITCQVLFTFESEETGKNYIAYTDNSTDEKGNTQVFASIYNPNDENAKFEPIESEKEWKIIETILETLQEEVRNQTNDKEEDEQ